MKKLYLVINQTHKPAYFYTYAENELEAKQRVWFKWGFFDEKRTLARELTEEEIEKLVIATDYYG